MSENKRLSYKEAKRIILEEERVRREREIEHQAYMEGWHDAFSEMNKNPSLVLRWCHADETEVIACRCYGDPHGKAVYHIHVMECSECGRTYEHVWGEYEYCPHCGRKVD